jgi:hypothetical protein
MLNLSKEYKSNWFDFIDYTPHKGQEMLHNAPDHARFIVACCGRRWGKSHSAAREAEIYLTQPGKVIWVVSPNYNTSEKIFRIVYEDMVIKKGYKPTQYSAKEQILKFEWDGGASMLCGKSAEIPSTLIGEGCDLIIIDEAAKIKSLKKIWEMYLRPTLSDKKGKAIFISTPDGYSYFHELYLRGKSKINDYWYSFNAPSWINQFAFPLGQKDPDLIEAKETLTKEIFEQEYGANFTSLSGRVYQFDRDLDVGEYRYNPMLPVEMSIDYGYRMPAVLFFQINKVGKKSIPHVNVIDEIVHQPNLTIFELAEKVKEKNYKITRCYGDPAGYQVSSSTGIGEAELFRQATGLRTFALRDKTSRSIASGISHVRSFFENAKGLRRIHINKKCEGLMADLETYRYPEHKDNDLKNIPIKDGKSDHSMDAFRYYFINKFPIKQSKYRTSK